MKTDPHFATGFWNVAHEVDGIPMRAIIRANSRFDKPHVRDYGHHHHKATTLMADLEAGAARRAAGEVVPPLPAREVLAYGVEPGEWLGEALVGGESVMLVVNAPTHEAAVADLAKLFGDLHAGETHKHAQERAVANMRRAATTP